jgi:ABC-type branched-subunit amino acid transport system permease subunit
LTGPETIVEPAVAGQGTGDTGPYEAELRQFLPLLAVGVVAILLVVPFVLVDYLGNPFELTFLTGILIYGILALSLDLIWGYGGIISLAQGTFFGIGAYAMAYMLLNTGGVTGVVIGIAIGVPVAALAGVALGLISFRARVGGLYFAIITLALALVAELAATTLDITGGDNGLFGVPGLASVGTRGAVVQYYLVLGVTVVVFALAWVFVNSHFGRVLTAARENELRAASIGFDVNTAKAVTFGISAGLAALAGVLFAPYNGIVNPDVVGFVTGANVLIWVAIGGRGFLVGALIGAVVLNYAQFKLTDLLEVFAGSSALSAWPLIFGLVFLLVILVFPNGLAGALSRLGGVKLRVRRRLPVPWVRWSPVPSAEEPPA